MSVIVSPDADGGCQSCPAREHVFTIILQKQYSNCEPGFRLCRDCLEELAIQIEQRGHAFGDKVGDKPKRIKNTGKKVRAVDPDKVAKGLGAERLDPNHPSAKRMRALKHGASTKNDLRNWSDIILPDKKHKE